MFGFGENKKEISALKEELASIKAFTGGTYKPLFHVSYDGEKNTGELGVLTKYDLDYASLRHRSWKAYLDDEVTQTVIRRYVMWIIGGGLKLQSEPITSLLESENINIDNNKFTRTVEDRFRIYASSKYADFSSINNLDKLAKTAYLNAIVGGDVLTVLRVVKGEIKVQLIDGAHVCTPFYGNEIKEAEGRGNTIKNGVEANNKGEHVAYWVKDKEGNFKRISAKGASSNKELAFMVYGLRYRIDDNRGIPIISTVLETLGKLNRYKEATVSSAEERAKIVYQIVHENFSTGESPLAKNLAKAFNADADQDIPIDVNGKQLADTVAVSTNKQTFNMPVGSELKSLDTKNDIYFKDFYSVNVNSICACIGIPPEVALSKYDSNFSASRAALKDWEHTIGVERKEFSAQFYQKIYNLWFELNVLRNKIQAPGYINAMASGDFIVTEAYKNARFVGATVPHIDPLKEVLAERAKLGESGKSIPLTTAEAATEALNAGDFDSNLKQYIDEYEKVDAGGLIQVVETKEKPADNEQ
jgi:hypothetical protein